MKTQLTPKPFVKWAGGKRKLLPILLSMLPPDFKNYDTYVEPFVGSGAFFFELKKEYPKKHFIINDLNVRLIKTYKALRDSPNELISLLKKIQSQFYNLEQKEKQKDFYYQQRLIFNDNTSDDLTIAALFIFLNRVCFCGLYRETKDGKFNVPFFSQKFPVICNEPLLRYNSSLLKDVIIMNEPYSGTAKFATNGTFYYLDPPYRPISKTSSFTAYVPEKFNDEQQHYLANFCQEIHAKGAAWLQSNSRGDDNFFETLYKKFHIYTIEAKRGIKTKGGKNKRITYKQLLNS